MSASLAAPAPGMPPIASPSAVRLAPFFQIVRSLPTVQGRERVGQFVWDLSLHHEPHVLVAAFLSSFRREQFLAPSFDLLPESISPEYLARAMMYPSYASRWSLDESIERSPLFRFVGAACWIRLVGETELAAAAAGMDVARLPSSRYLYDVPAAKVGPDFAATFSPLAVMASVYFAPAPLDPRVAPYSHRQQHGPAWTPWRARYYSYLLRLIAILLLPHSMLDAQTMEYMDGEQVPAPPGQPRFNQIATYAGAQRFPIGSRQAADAADNAWEDYLDWLAARNTVPRLLVDWRLNRSPWDRARGKPYQGAWQVETLDQWQWCVDALCHDSHELATWRKRAARWWGMRDERDLTLYLMDPLMGPQQGKD